MAKIESLLGEAADVRKRRYRMVVSIIIGVILLHVAGGVVAGVFIVAKYIFPPPANFVVKKDIRLPAKKREQKMNMAAVDAIAPKPTLSDKMQSSRPTAFSLPDVPDMPLDQMLPLDPSQLLSDQLASLSNTDALGASSGAAAAGGGGFGGKGVSFLGVESSGDRILLLIDVSNTVVKNANQSSTPYTKVGEETLKLFQSLPITARFGIAFFRREYRVFKQELIPNSYTNRKNASPWIMEKFKGRECGGPKAEGMLDALALAKKLKPDLVYIVTDASCQAWTYPEGIPWDMFKQYVSDIKDEAGRSAKINFILFAPKENDLNEMKKIDASLGNVTVTVKK